MHGSEMASKKPDDSAAIPVIEVTEPVAEKLLEKNDNTEPENLLQIIIDQQKAKRTRKKFIFRDKDGHATEISSSEDKGMARGDSTDSEHSSTSAASVGTTGDQN